MHYGTGVARAAGVIRHICSVLPTTPKTATFGVPSVPKAMPRGLASSSATTSAHSGSGATSWPARLRA